MSTEFEEWLATRPESIQKLAREFPPGTSFVTDKHPQTWVVGYREPDTLICSVVNPRVNYQEALLDKNKLLAHAQCIREAISKSTQRDEAAPTH